jgi:glyoxylase-like metal-dependent hydrolase (beta-lactamase superfamily II)
MLKVFKRIALPFYLISLISSCISVNHSNFDFEVTSVAKNVYSIVSPSKGLPTPENKGWNSNSHFVVTGKGVLLFDTGSSESIGNGIKNAIKSVTDQPVRWIVNSHSHADHWLGNAAFTDTVEEIIASDHTVRIMKKYGEEDVKFYSKVTKGSIGETQLLYPNKVLNQREKYNFGSVSVQFIFSNDGHSPGDILMWLPKQKIIFGGDALSSDWMPMITGHGNVSNLINTLYSIIKLNPKTVLTGHGKATTVKSVIRDADLLSSIWKHTKEGFENRKSIEEILADVKTKLELKYNSLYKDFDSEIKRHVTLMYKLQQ